MCQTVERWVLDGSLVFSELQKIDAGGGIERYRDNIIVSIQIMFFSTDI